MNFRAPPKHDGAGHRARRSAKTHDKSGVLSIKPFRRLWIALSLSSLGDWLSIIALTALAPSLSHGNAAVAVGGVWLATLLPALLLGPLAGAMADRLDRRTTMIVGDVIRGLLFLSIPLFPNLTWIYAAKFLAGCATLFWTPATNASVPNLVPPDKLERANQLSLLTTYGTAPVAAGLFSVLALVSKVLGSTSHFFTTNNVDLALYFNAATYFISAVTVFMIREIAKRSVSDKISSPSVLKSVWEGWRFIGGNPIVRGLAIGMVGAFIAAGVVIGLGYTYITQTLHGGNAGWGLVFAAIFVGIALGMLPGTRFLKDFSRRRLFGVAIVSAAIPLAIIAVVPNLVIVTLGVVVIGAMGGIAYATGFTIVGLEVDDSTRGRVFAFFASATQVILFLVIAVSPFLSKAFTELIHSATGSSNLKVGGVVYASAGQNVVLLLAALIAVLVGISAYRQMDDRRGVPLRQDLVAAIRGEPIGPVPSATDSLSAADEPPSGHGGLFIALEGGEGAGKTTQARMLAIWLREQGFDVITTREPGATKIGMRLRALLLDTAHSEMSPRAEALMYAADRAQHVDEVIRPALARGAVVITDRYVDSSLAYQGAARGLRAEDIAWLSRWATGDLVPDLTILLDLPPGLGLGRRTSSADRLEAEPTEFHERVRGGFLDLARREPGRYLVLDATRPAAELTAEVKERLPDLLPDPVPVVSEADTGSFPAITDDMLPADPELPVTSHRRS